MWTKKSHFVYFHLRIGHFHLPLLLPLYVLRELVDVVEDVLLLFGRFAGIEPHGVMKAIVEVGDSLTGLGRFDLVDVDVSDKGQKEDGGDGK